MKEHIDIYELLKAFGLTFLSVFVKLGFLKDDDNKTFTQTAMMVGGGISLGLLVFYICSLADFGNTSMQAISTCIASMYGESIVKHISKKIPLLIDKKLNIEDDNGTS